jgi:hypothetical protein
MLDVRGVDDEHVAVEAGRWKSPSRCAGVRTRMRTAVHPDVRVCS